MTLFEGEEISEIRSAAGFLATDFLGADFWVVGFVDADFFAPAVAGFLAAGFFGVSELTYKSFSLATWLVYPNKAGPGIVPGPAFKGFPLIIGTNLRV